MKKPAQTKKQFKTNITIITFIIFINFIFFSARSVSAQTTQSFTISPPTIKFDLNPGEKIEKSIKITNNTDTPMVFYANIQDFVVTDKNGTPELLPPDSGVDNRFAASTWATVLPDSIPVAPGKTTTTTIYLQVPGDARPGGRYISVAFMPKAEGLTDGSGATVNSVAAALVYITVMGDIQEAGQVTRFTAPPLSEYGPIDFSAEIFNSGDIHITPKATIEVKNLFGRKVFYSALPSDTNVFPGTSRILKTTWDKKFLFGPYKANLSGFFGQEDNLKLAAVTSFWVIPYKIILLVVGLLIAGYVLYKKSTAPKEIVEETPQEEK